MRDTHGLPNVGDVITSPKFNDKGEAEYVVTDAVNKEYQGLMFPGHYERGEYVVTAQQLNTDGSYNPNGVFLFFSLDSDKSEIEVSEIQVVRKMRQWFV
jgi:hypothetical protein